MAVQKIRWYVKAQLGVLLLPAGLCVFGEAVIRKGIPDEMPSFAKKHSAQDIADITAYLRTLR